jgi:hypothetical protein
MRRVLVCGGRDFKDRERAYLIMDIIHASLPVSVVIHGGARGADTLAGEWAFERGVPVEEFKAEWTKHGKKAGPIRNQKMLDEGKPDLVVAFHGGKGTDDMVKRARKAGLPVFPIEQWR